MAERKIDPRLQELYDAGVPVYSISRVDCINRCLYEAKLTYIDHNHGDENIYGLLGTRIHDVLEKIMNNEATEADLLPAMNDELADCELFGYDFPKDRNGESSIRGSWVANMTHFCTTYRRPKAGNYKTEMFFLYKTPRNHYLQGFIDLTLIRNDGTINVFDYKTSSLYKGEGLKEHGRQLVTYALAMEQQGYKVTGVAWIFLKYAEVRFLGKKTAKSKEKTQISKVVERRKIVRELERYVKDDLAELGLDEFNIEDAIDTMLTTNELPEIVKDRYKILPYVCRYELTDEVKQECIQYLDDTIDMWENCKAYPPKAFVQRTKLGKERSDTFYCTQLCSHGKQCTYLKEYLDTLGSDSNDEDDLFM